MLDILFSKYDDEHDKAVSMEKMTSALARSLKKFDAEYIGKFWQKSHPDVDDSMRANTGANSPGSNNQAKEGPQSDPIRGPASVSPEAVQEGVEAMRSGSEASVGDDGGAFIYPDVPQSASAQTNTGVLQGQSRRESESPHQGGRRAGTGNIGNVLRSDSNGQLDYLDLASRREPSPDQGGGLASVAPSLLGGYDQSNGSRRGRRGSEASNDGTFSDDAASSVASQSGTVAEDQNLEGLDEQIGGEKVVPQVPVIPNDDFDQPTFPKNKKLEYERSEDSSSSNFLTMVAIVGVAFVLAPPLGLAALIAVGAAYGNKLLNDENPKISGAYDELIGNIMDNARKVGPEVDKQELEEVNKELGATTNRGLQNEAPVTEDQIKEALKNGLSGSQEEQNEFLDKACEVMMGGDMNKFRQSHNISHDENEIRKFLKESFEQISINKDWGFEVKDEDNSKRELYGARIKELDDEAKLLQEAVKEAAKYLEDQFTTSDTKAETPDTPRGPDKGWSR